MHHFSLFCDEFPLFCIEGRSSSFADSFSAISTAELTWEPHNYQQVELKD